MIPFLVAVFGPIKGSKIPLGAEITIGRENDNSVSINDVLLSRHHCAIRYEGGKYRIFDLQSRNGIFVNGLPIGEQVLNHCDRLEIGSSLFVVAMHDDVSSADSNFLEDDQLDAKITVASPSGESAIQQSDARTLLRISQEFYSVDNLEQFGAKLLEFIFSSIPAQRGAIVLDEHGKIRLIASKNKTSEAEAVSVSRTILNQALKTGTAIMADDIQRDETLQKSQSLLEYKPQSILCIPFVIGDRSMGAVYLDIASGSKSFSTENLELTQAIVSIANPAFKNIQELEAEKNKNELLRNELLLNQPIIGESPKIRKVHDVIQRFAQTDSSLLIVGESGVGKELTARVIHALSHRSQHPFVSIHCASMPDNLLESELFGHEQGAFSGALFQKKGKLQAAEGGTIFLDEIAQLTLPLQAKLLRAIVDQEIEPIGATISVKINVRFIAATNQDLQDCIQNKSFRQDLYYKLNAAALKLPALRERGDDVLLLARYFANRCSRNSGRALHGLSAEAQEILRSYKWPGNVREMENAIERAVLMSGSEVLLPEDLPEHILECAPYKVPTGTQYHEALQIFKKQIVLKAFEGTNKNYNEAASRLGIHLNYLYRLVRNLNLKDEI